jgi:hypothetical protein
MKPKSLIVSGYFNPRQEGHIEYFGNTKANQLIVIVNSVHKRALKVSAAFQKEDQSQSSMNTFRIFFNEYFGYNFPVL